MDPNVYQQMQTAMRRRALGHRRSRHDGPQRERDGRRVLWWAHAHLLRVSLAGVSTALLLTRSAG